jgi:hypothetical protein
VLFLLLLLLSAPQLMAAPRIDYNRCMADCETAFPNVLQSETTCAQTLTSIHYDMVTVFHDLVATIRTCITTLSTVAPEDHERAREATPVALIVILVMLTVIALAAAVWWRRVRLKNPPNPKQEETP